MSKGTVIRSGSVRVRIFASRSGKYLRHEIRWIDQSGRRRRQKFSNPAEARREAQRIADDLSRGHHHAELTLAELASCRAAAMNLYGTGKTIELATAEYAEVRRFFAAAGLPQPGLKELAAFWLENQNATAANLTVSDAVEKLLQVKLAQGVSARWLGALKSQLRRFAREHPVNVSALKAADVRQWAYSLPVGPRARNNHLAAVKLLFNLGELRSHRERAAVIEIPAITIAAPENALWTPGEFTRLLNAAPAHLLPVLVLGGFGKLRSSEIMRVEMDNLKLKEKRVLLHAGQTKTRRWRIVPLPACAVAWLRHAGLQASGRLWPWGTQKFNADLRALATACGLKWRPNALRNSAITYDQVCHPDVARVAREAGNSAGVVETEYLALNGITKATAKAWFRILPPRQKRVIVPMEAAK